MFSRGFIVGRMSSPQVSSPTSELVLDPYDYAFQEDPYPTYRRCREEDPWHHNPELDIWVMTRHADIAQALRVEGTFSNAMGVSIDKGAWGPEAHRTMSFLAMDPPHQQRLRSLVSRGFTPRRVAELAPQIQRLTDLHLDQCLEMESFDWIHDFAANVVRPAAEEWDEREEFPWPIVEEAAKIGLYGFDFMANAMLSDASGLTLPVAIEELFWGDAGIGLRHHGRA